MSPTYNRIHQYLTNAKASISLAQKLLRDMEEQESSTPSKPPVPSPSPSSAPEQPTKVPKVRKVQVARKAQEPEKKPLFYGSYQPHLGGSNYIPAAYMSWPNKDTPEETVESWIESLERIDPRPHAPILLNPNEAREKDTPHHVEALRLFQKRLGEMPGMETTPVCYYRTADFLPLNPTATYQSCINVGIQFFPDLGAARNENRMVQRVRDAKRIAEGRPIHFSVWPRFKCTFPTKNSLYHVPEDFMVSTLRAAAEEAGDQLKYVYLWDSLPWNANHPPHPKSESWCDKQTIAFLEQNGLYDPNPSIVQKNLKDEIWEQFEVFESALEYTFSDSRTLHLL